MPRAAAIIAMAILGVFVAVRGVATSYVFWRVFRDSGYPWWVQAPAAGVLLALFWMLAKRYKPGRFDGPF